METLQPTSQAEYAAQGKSNNYVAAQAAGRLTAGQAAKVLTRRLARKILAKEIESLASEFHHAGRFGGNQAKRIFFFTPEQVARITLADIERAAAPVWGWVLGFRADYSGRYGKKRFVPIVAESGLISADRAHRLEEKFHPLNESEAEEAKAAIGKVLPAYSNDWREAR
jgi:hypothetical protein